MAFLDNLADTMSVVVPGANVGNTQDMTARNNYMLDTKPNNPQAALLKTQWSNWYLGLTNWQKMQDSIVHEASNRVHAFNLANSKSAGERAAVKEQRMRGMSLEEMRGKRRVVDSAGNYPKAKGVTVLSASKGTLLPGARPTIRYGSKGDAVKAWQTIVGLRSDGVFGNQTKAATIAWQKEHGLKADGIVGSATWAAALGKDAPKMPLEMAAVTPVAPITAHPTEVPAGTVIPTQALKIPVSRKPIKRKKVSPAAVEASTVPAVQVAPVQAGMIPGLEKFKKMSTEKKVATVGGLSLLGYILSKVVKF